MIEKLDLYSLDTVKVQGSDLGDWNYYNAPDITRDNFIQVFNKQNEIIDALNRLLSIELNNSTIAQKGYR